MITGKDSQVFARFCESSLNLNNARLGEEYYYNSLPLCVIDAVFSIGVKYTSTKNVILRFCNYFEIVRIMNDRFNSLSSQMSISDFIKIYNEFGVGRMSEEVYMNHQ